MPKAAAPPAGTAPRKGGDDVKLSKIEQETIINFNVVLKNQLLALCRTHPGQVRQTAANRWGGLSFELPKKWLKVSPPRILSPAQRAVLDRMNQKQRGN